MKPVWKWLIGIAVALFVIGTFAMPLFMHSFYGYGMMSGYGPTWGMPMYGGFGFMGFGGLLSVLIQLGVLVLIVLGIIWLVGELKKQNQHRE